MFPSNIVQNTGDPITDRFFGMPKVFMLLDCQVLLPASLLLYRACIEPTWIQSIQDDGHNGITNESESSTP